MAALRDAAGEEVTVLFDWALAGYAAPGAEISNMVWSSLLEFQLDIAELDWLEAAVLDSYIQGLGAAGWQADPDADAESRLASAVETNVRSSAWKILKLDPKTEGFQVRETDVLVSAVYELTTGRVRILEKHPWGDRKIRSSLGTSATS